MSARGRGLALVNANVVTMDPSKPRAEAVYARGGVVRAVGSVSAVMRRVRPGDEVLDLEGLTVLPGFVDSHIHLMGLALSRKWVDLRGARSVRELVEALRERAALTPEGEWVLGRGWDHELLAEERYPTRADLDSVSERHYVVAVRVCGHACAVNSRVLKLMRERLGVELAGELAEGLVRGSLLSRLFELVPKLSRDELRRGLVEVTRELAAAGITTAHAMSVTEEELTALVDLAREGLLPIRVRAYVVPSLMHRAGLVRSLEGMLRVAGVKLTLDGSLGARTAALEEPYSDEPGSMGVMHATEGELVAALMECRRLGLQPAMHAIGDRAVRLALSAIRAVYGRDLRPYRPRLEHASLLSEALLREMAEMRGLVVSIQPTFVTSDFWAVSRVGEHRAKYLYAFRSMAEAGVRLAVGSDAPVEDFKPLRQLRVLVDRGRREGAELHRLTPSEVLTAAEALAAYTTGGAYAAFDEGVISSISPGKLADMVVLSGDPLKVSADDMERLEVVATFVGGRLAHVSRALS